MPTNPRNVIVTEKNISRIMNMRDDTRFFAYKLTDAGGRGPQYPDKSPVLVCRKFAVLAVPDADTDPDKSCAKGVNVSTYQEARHHALVGWGTNKRWIYAPGLNTRGHQRTLPGRLWMVEFAKQDIAALPRSIWSTRAWHHKFRLFRCTVVKEIEWPTK